MDLGWRGTCEEAAAGQSRPALNSDLTVPPIHMKKIRIALAILIVTAGAAGAAQIKASSNAESSDDAANNASSHLGQLLSHVHRSSAAANSFSLERPSWSGFARPEHSLLEGTSFYDSRYRASLKQSGGHLGELHFFQRDLRGFAHHPDPARLPSAAPPIVSAVHQVPDNGGGFALLGLGILGLGSVRSLLKRFS